MAGPGDLRKLRLAGRLANGFILDLNKLGGDQRNLLDGILRTALLMANEGHMNRDPLLQRRYARIADSVPETARRPASVHGVATSLRVPYETARRRFGAMAKLGICRMTPQGVVITQWATDTPFFAMACQYEYERLKVLYGRLRAIGALDPPPPSPRATEEGDPPLRVVARLVAEWVLRFTEPISENIGDVITGLVLLDTVAANTEHLPDGDQGAAAEPIHGFLADSERRPVSALELSRRLAVPAETLRRHMKRLLDRGLCVRAARGGYIVPVEALARPFFIQAIVDNQANVTRLFAGLAEFGVIARWERELSERAA
jgi:hypothetical protein